LVCPGCTTQKPTKFDFGKTTNYHNFCLGCQNWTYCIWFWGRKIISTNLAVKKVAKSLGLVLVARHKNLPNLLL